MGLWMGVEGIFSGCWYLIFRFLGGIVVQSVKFRYIVLTFVSEYDTILVTGGCGMILAVGFLGVVVSERRSRKIYGAERMLAFSERNKFSRLRSRLGFPAFSRKSASPRWVGSYWCRGGGGGWGVFAVVSEREYIFVVLY